MCILSQLMKINFHTYNQMLPIKSMTVRTVLAVSAVHDCFCIFIHLMLILLIYTI